MFHSAFEIWNFKVVLSPNKTPKTNFSSEKKKYISPQLKYYYIKEMLYIYFPYSSEKSTIIHIILENDFFRENVLMKESKKDWSKMNSYQFFPFLYVLFSVYMWNEREELVCNFKKIEKKNPKKLRDFNATITKSDHNLYRINKFKKFIYCIQF